MVVAVIGRSGPDLEAKLSEGSNQVYYYAIVLLTGLQCVLLLQATC